MAAGGFSSGGRRFRSSKLNTRGQFSVLFLLSNVGLWLIGLGFIAQASSLFGVATNASYESVKRRLRPEYFLGSYVAWAIGVVLDVLCIFITWGQLKRPSDKNRKITIYSMLLLNAVSLAVLYIVESYLAL